MKRKLPHPYSIILYPFPIVIISTCGQFEDLRIYDILLIEIGPAVGEKRNLL